SEAAERYASALFDLAREEGALDRVSDSAATLKTMLEESEDLRRLVESPAFAAEDKQDALIALAEKSGLDALMRQFLGVLAGNRRANELAGVLAVFARLMAEHRGVTTAEVVSAKPLSDAQRDAIAKSLAGSLGRQVEVNAEVKPEILGGLVVKVGSRMFDSSLKSKLARLNASLKGA
ncbi:MAG: F0F1 ATP synthase subunit delta, partial [Maricaulaceae bacterium]